MLWFLAMVGHGRLLELFLSWVKLGLGVWIILTGSAATVPALADLSWYYSSPILAAPFFVVGVLQLAGVSLNMAGHEISWVFRAAGSSLAIFMWMWILFKTPFAGGSSPLVVVACVAVPFSSLLFYKAWNRLPVPGAPGQR